jgi:large subunit ribosomal protein L25
MSETKLNVTSRDERGSNASRRLRGEGLVPAVVYGGGLDPAAITVHRHTVVELLNKSGAGENTIFLLSLGKQQRHAMIKDMQVDPMTGRVDHIDFQRILLSEKVQVEVPVELVGTAVGVKMEGGLLDFVTRQVLVECLPTEIPEHLSLDVSGLHIGHHLEVSDLVLPEGVVLAEEDDKDKVIVSLAAARVEVEEEVEEEETLLETDKEEPEVLGRKEPAKEKE